MNKDNNNIWKLKYEKYKLKYLKLRDSMHGGVELSEDEKEKYRTLFKDKTADEINNYYSGFRYAIHTELSVSEYTYMNVIKSKRQSPLIGYPEILDEKYKIGIEDGVRYKNEHKELSDDLMATYLYSLSTFFKELKTEKISDSESFSIISYNIYNSLENSEPFSIMDIIEGFNPTYIFLQEATINTPLKDYTLQLYPNDDNNKEKVGLMFKGTKKDTENIESIVFDYSKTKKEQRYGFIIDHNGIRIANIHLAGGRHLDMFLKLSIVTNDELLFRKIIDYRLDLLKKIIKSNPDVIVGDFNTDLLQFNADSFITYLKSIVRTGLENSEELDKPATKFKVTEYNNSVFELLTNSQYEYAKLDNKDDRGTNMRGNTVVDGVWYKKDKLTLNVSNVIYDDRFKPKDDIKYPVSDHYPVYAKFTVK